MVFFSLVDIVARECRKRIAIVWVLGIATVALSLVTPLQVGRLTNLVAGAQGVSWSQVQRAILYLVAAQLGLSTVGYWRRRTEIILQEASLRTLTLDMFRRILRFPTDFFRREAVEKIAARALEDTNKVSDFVIEALVKVPLSVVSLIALAALMLVTNWFLGLCMIALALLSGYFVLFDRRIQRGNQRTWQTHDSIRVQAHEMIAGVSELRSHCAFDHGLGQLRRSLEDYREVRTEMARLNALFGAITPLITALQNGVLYWVGALLCLGGSSLAAIAGQMTWGDVIQFMLVAEMFRQPVQSLAGFLLQWRMTEVSLGRVGEYMNQPRPFERREASGPSWPARPDIAFQNARVVAHSGTTILTDIDLTIAAGDHVAFVGPAGCGKSTAVHLINRLVEPTSGRMTLGGQPVADYDILTLAHEVAFVSQKPVLFNTSIRNNILLALRRPSSTTVEDEEGALDVQRFDEIRTGAEMDRRLAQVVELVGLESDVLRKALDNPIRDRSQAAQIQQQITDLRSEVAGRTADWGDSVVIPFDHERWIPGTLAENLFQARLWTKDETCWAAQQVVEQLGSAPILDALLALGYGRLVSQRSQALETEPEASALSSYAARRKPVPVGATAAFHEWHGANKDLALPLQRLLVELALGIDVEVVRERVQPARFDSTFGEARRLLGANDPRVPGSWRHIGTRGYVAGLDLRENLLCGRVNRRMLAAEERVDQVILNVLKDRGLFLTTLLLGLEFRVGEGGKFLSGGQRQKVVLARALIKDPSILLLDEATASLDAISQALVVQNVRQRCRERTVVWVSHRLSTIRDFDRVVVLNRGQVVEEGTYDELLRQCRLFSQLVRQGAEQAAAVRAAAVPEMVVAPRKGEEEEVTEPEELRHRLAQCPFFNNVKSEQLGLIAQRAKIVECPAGTVLFHRGDPAQELYVILQGEVEFFVEPDGGGSGQPDVVTCYGAGRAFGEIGLFTNGLRTLAARAKTDLELCLLKRDDLLDLIAADAQIAIALLQTLSSRLAEITEQAYNDQIDRGGAA